MKLMQKKQSMDRYPKEYSVDDVMDWYEANKGGHHKKKVEFDGHTIKVNSLRYANFEMNGVVCVECGLVGSVFYKERNFTHNKQPTAQDAPYHLNLYAIDAEGEEVLITKDHIVALSLGGVDHVDNMQTMCTVCNCSKGSKTVEEWTGNK